MLAMINLSAKSISDLMCHVFLDVHFYVDVDDITRIMFALNLLPYLIIDGAVIQKWKCHC